MIRAANMVWASMLALALASASPALAGATRDCADRGAKNRTACRARSAKASSVNPRLLGSAFAAIASVNDPTRRTRNDANVRLTADTVLTRDSIEPGHGMAADRVLMRALESKTVSIGSRIKRLRAGAANAAASPMSGNVFRADSTFSLTGNVGSYGGTRAGAIQMSNLISQRVALNAGVIKGFNKVSETVGRVGITLGW